MNTSIFQRQRTGPAPGISDSILNGSVSFNDIYEDTQDQSQQENHRDMFSRNLAFDRIQHQVKERSYYQEKILMNRLVERHLGNRNVLQYQQSYSSNEHYQEPKRIKNLIKKKKIPENSLSTQIYKKVDKHPIQPSSQMIIRDIDLTTEGFQNHIIIDESEQSLNPNQFEYKNTTRQLGLEQNMSRLELENNMETEEEKDKKEIKNQTNAVSLNSQLMYGLCDSKKYCIYNECIVDFDLFDDRSEILNQSTCQSLFGFKQTSKVLKLNNGDIIHVCQTCGDVPLRDYTFLLEMLKSLGNSDAKRWYQVLEDFQRKTRPQIEFLAKMMQTSQTQLQSLRRYFAERRQFSEEFAQSKIRQIERNQYAMYLQYNFDFEVQSMRQSCTGYSRKILEIMGIPIKDAPSIFLRKGPLDLTCKKLRVWDMLLCAISLVDHPKNDIIDDVKGQVIIQTLDLIKLEAKVRFRLHNLTNRFDVRNKTQFPFGDDFLVEVIYEISESNLEKFKKLREQKNVFNSFSIYDVIDGEFEYLMGVENFLNKYYSSSISSSYKSTRPKALMPEQGLDTERNSLSSIGSNDFVLSKSSDLTEEPCFLCDPLQPVQAKMSDFDLQTSFIVSNSSLLGVFGEKFMDLKKNLQNQFV